MAKKIMTDHLTVQNSSTEPITPGTNVLYAKNLGTKTLLRFKDALNKDTSLQSSIWENNIVRWTQVNTAAGLWLGTIGAGAGNYTTSYPINTSVYTSMKRGVYSNAATTTNQVLGQRNTEAMFFRDTSNSRGGYFFAARFGFETFTNGGRLFAGLSSNITTTASINPSSVNNTVGFCIDAADNGAISFLTRGTSATKASTGLTAASGKGYDITIYAAFNSTEFRWKIVDLNSGTEVIGTAVSTLPSNGTMLAAGVLASNGTLTPANSIQLGINSIYIETLY